MRSGLVSLSIFLLACGNGDFASFEASVDSSLDAPDGNACTTSCTATLESACSKTDCPPSLDSPSFYAWAQSRIVPISFKAPDCMSFPHCPEMVMLFFGDGTDCGHEFLFDVTTKKLVAVTNTCDGFQNVNCAGASECIPNRCMPNDNDGYNLSPPACPPLPEAGLPDAAVTDGSDQ